MPETEDFVLSTLNNFKQDALKRLSTQFLLTKTIIDEFISYRTDYTKIFIYPIFLLESDEAINSFMLKCESSRKSNFEEEITFDEWTNLKIYASLNANSKFYEQESPLMLALISLRDKISSIQNQEYASLITLENSYENIIEALEDFTNKFKGFSLGEAILKQTYDTFTKKYPDNIKFKNDENNNRDNLLSINKNNEAYIIIISDFKSYQLDLVKMMQRPILANLLNPEVKAFNILCRKIERNEISLGLTEFEIEWESLQTYADTIRTTHLSLEHSIKFNDAQVFLTKAFNDESTENEKLVSIKGLQKNLVGILPVTDLVINNIKEKVGLQEISK